MLHSRTRRRRSLLDALRIRDFRYFWLGLAVSNVGAWMQIFALGILVVQIAVRDGVPELAPFYLGLMGLARAIPGLPCTLLAGAVADRRDRRRILFITQGTMAATAAALALAAYLGAANLPIVLAATAIQSAAFAFDNPARQSMVPRIVPLSLLSSAIGLQSAAFQGASILGPLFAGLLYLPIGIPGLLAVNAISFTTILAALLVMPAIPPLGSASQSLLASVMEGGRYVRANPVLVWILAISGTVFVVAGPVSALLPALAGESLYNGMSWLSLLLTAMGVGAFCGALVVMNVGRFRSLGTVFVGGAVLNGIALLLFAFSAEPFVALAFSFLTGLSGTMMAGMGNNMLQATTADAYRGRVMSLWGLLFIGLMPIGQLALGALGSLLGIHAALAIGGAIALAAGVYALVRLPLLREWRAPSRRGRITPAQTAQVPPPTVG
ncbi:MAG TPA: MFS transporter [Candidatus Limnocylindrales bacterium]|nr:MFS transporter [Candidatus Limnocylindrales bacterium]